MKTKRIVLLVAVLLAASEALSFADIGENFEPGGLVLLGGGSFYINFGSFLEPTNEYTYWDVTVGPGISVCVANNVALLLSSYFRYTSEQMNLNTITRNMSFGAGLGIWYNFVRDPKAQRGLVPAVAAALEFWTQPGVGDKVGGVETDDKSLFLILGPSVTVRMNFFLNDRLVPYVGLKSMLGYVVTEKDVLGSTVTQTSRQRFRLDGRVEVGMSVFIPQKKAVLFAF